MFKGDKLDQLLLDRYKERLFERELWITDVYNQKSASLIIGDLIALDRKSNADITIYVSCNGATIQAALAVFDTIQRLRSNVITVAHMQALSGGFQLFMAGKERYAYPSSSFLVHCIQEHIMEGKSKENKIDIIEEERMEEVMINQLASKAQNYDFWKGLVESNKDRWFSPEEALKLGIATKLL